MADEAKFSVRLIDKVKGPARSASKAVNELGRQFTTGAKGVGMLTERLGGASDGFKRLERSSSGVMAVLGGNLLSAGVGKVLQMGAAVAGAAAGMVTFGQNSALAFGQLAKHGATPEMLFDHASDLAKRFGLDVMDTTKQYQKFLSLQFDPKSIDSLIRMGADLRVLGADAEDVKGVFLALGQIRSKGKLQMEELQAQLGERGIASDIVLKHVSEIRGQGESSDAIRKALSAGRIDAVTGIEAIQRAIKEKLQEENLGDAGAKFADTTIDGLIGRIKAYGQSAGRDVMKHLEGPITSVLGGAFDSFSKYLESPAGVAAVERFGLALGNAAQGAVDFAVGIGRAVSWTSDFLDNNWDGITAALTGLGVAIGVAVVPSLIAYTASMGAAIATTAVAAAPFVLIGGAVAALSYGIIKLIDNWGAVTSYMGEAWEGVKLVFSDAVSWFAGIGESIIDGIIGGLTAGWTRLTDMVGGIGESVAGKLRDVLGIHSPSRVTMDMGMYLGEGMAIGMQRSEGLVSSAGADMASASVDSAMWGPPMRSLQADGPMQSAGGGPASVTVNVNVDASGQDANEVAEQTARSVRREIEAVFRQLAYEV